MISYLNGEVVSKTTDQVIVDIGGIGYALKVSLNDYESVNIGHKAKFFVYEHIREDAFDLFGFLHQGSLSLFNQLLSVKNVGPKVALAILSIGSEASIRESIAGGDVKKLQTAKGVGKRAAEQIVVELRDKVGLVSSTDAEGIVNRSALDVSDEAVQALIALGYSEYDAQKALAGTDKSMPTEQRIKQALKGNF